MSTSPVRCRSSKRCVQGLPIACLLIASVFAQRPLAAQSVPRLEVRRLVGNEAVFPLTILSADSLQRLIAPFKATDEYSSAAGFVFVRDLQGRITTRTTLNVLRWLIELDRNRQKMARPDEVRAKRPPLKPEDQSPSAASAIANQMAELMVARALSLSEADAREEALRLLPRLRTVDLIWLPDSAGRGQQQMVFLVTLTSD